MQFKLATELRGASIVTKIQARMKEKGYTK